MTRIIARRLGCLVGLLAGLAIAAPALAWGPQGHALIADIAAAHLTPSAQAQVSHLLARDAHERLDEIASWADAIRSRRPATSRWHYVNIPLSATHYQATRDCPNDDCVVAKIARFARILGNTDAAASERVEALKFVVHFVADVQQPLHATNHDDKGGNDVKLHYFGHRRNLHSVWDSGIVDHALGLYVHRHYSIDYGPTRRAARRLDDRISAHDRKAWSRGIRVGRLERTAVRWADQAHRLARTVAYGDLPDPPRQDWSSTYQRKAWPVVRRQIQRGGVRLAGVLNAELSH